MAKSKTSKAKKADESTDEQMNQLFQDIEKVEEQAVQLYNQKMQQIIQPLIDYTKDNKTMTTNKEELAGYTENDIPVDVPSLDVKKGEKQQFTIDFSSAGEGFTLIPEIRVLARVKQIEMKPGNAAPYLNFQFMIADEGEFLNQYVWQIYSLSGKALWRLKPVLEAFGFYDLNSFNLSKNEANFVDNPEFFDNLVYITIQHVKDQNGNLRAGVEKVESAADAATPTWQ